MLLTAFASIDAPFLSRLEIAYLVTRAGDLDIAFSPAGTGGFADLQRRAGVMMIQNLPVPVAALDDVIRSKEAANRPKDQRTLPMLRQLLDEIRKQSGQ
jgi:hypothetical protein